MPSKIILLIIGLTFLILSACSSEPPTVTEPPQPETITVEEPESVELTEPTVNNEGTDGYPAPESGYPGPSDENRTDPETLNRPDQLTQFPGLLAFSSDRIGLSDVFILNGETGLLEKFESSVEAYEPAWTANCQTMGVTGKTGVNAFQLFVGETAGGTAAQSLPTHSGENPFDYGLTWSPDGQTIAFHRLTPPKVNVCFANASTGELINCMQNSGSNNAMPAWSPDGTKLIFSSDRSGNYELYSTSYPEDGNYVQLTNNSDLDYDPEFSPDGTKVTYSSRRTSHFDIYVMNVDGSGEVQITDIFSDDRAPTWVGNDKIAFVSDKTSNDEIYIVDVANSPFQDLTQENQLTFNLASDSDPAWCSTN
ncbi:MAG: hypothetical protein AAGD96_22865 [Chloroflexota bacterium]